MRVVDHYGNVLRLGYRVKKVFGGKEGTVLETDVHNMFGNALVKWDDSENDEWVPAEQLMQTDRITHGRRRKI